MASLTSKDSHQTIYCLFRQNPTSNPVTMKMSKWTIVKNGEQCKLTLIFFWKRWLSEYLPTLSPRTKWKNKQQNFAVGDLVIVRNKNTPKSHWLLARILAIYPGDDGIIRTVKIQTPSGEFVRPSQLLLLLDHSKQ